jgi:diguanylate cyclase (GGDEF)-like protein/PAS domain S-box-containing protein
MLYLLPVVLVVTVTLIRSVLFPELRYAPYIAFFPAITVSALYGGVGPGFIAIILSMMVVSNFVVSGLSSLSNMPGGLEGMIVFMGSGTVIVMICSQLSRAKQRISMEAQRLQQSELSLEAELAGHRRADEELKRLSYENKLILESAGEGICKIDTQGLVAFANKAAADMLGYSIDELIGHQSHNQWHHTRPDGTQYPLDECPIYASYRKGLDYFGEEVFWKKDDTRVLVDFTCKPILEKDNILGAVITFRDITARKQAEESISKLAAIVESSDDAIVGKSLDGIITSWNSGAEKLYGYTKEEAVGNSISLLVPPDRSDETIGLLEQIREGKRVDHYETVRMKKNGDLIDVSITISPVKDYTGSIIGASAIVRDITEKKHTEEMLRQLSTTDGLTGIANRRAFDMFLDEEWRRALRSKNQISILMIDVDFFKKYNDTYGHLQGDECLRSVAAILKSVARRPGDMAARFGGEEFVVLLSTTDTGHAVSIAEKIRRDIEALEMPHETSEISRYVTVSIGVISEVPDPNMSANDFLQCADEALYKGKKEGRNRIAFKELSQCRLAPSPNGCNPAL